MSERLPVRFSDRAWEALKAAADRENVTPATWVRRIVEKALGVNRES